MEPWKTKEWWVSPFNFHPDVQKQFQPPPSIEFYDVTLREADECAGALLQVEDKVEIARALDRAGVHRIEVGLITPNSYQALTRILDQGFEEKIYAAGKLITPENLERAIACGVRRITLGTRTSDLFIETVLGSTREKVMASTRKAVSQAKDKGLYVNLFLSDAPRADLRFLQEMTQAATAEWGVDAITVVDTLGISHPQAFAWLIRQVRQWCEVPVEAHCHNDFGLGTAIAINAYLAGASVVHVSVNGIGYRAGNPPLEEVATALRVLYGVETGVQLNQLTSLSELLAARSGVVMAYNKPLVGRGAFAYEQWGDLRKWEEKGMKAAGMPLDPSVVGNRLERVLSKWSDRAMLELKLSELGLPPGAANQESLLARVKELIYQKGRPLRAEELKALCEEQAGA